CFSRHKNDAGSASPKQERIQALMRSSFAMGSYKRIEKDQDDIADSSDDFVPWEPDFERARLYHERADEIVQLAAGIKNYRARDTLLRLAISYDQMAEKIELHLPKRG